MLLNPQISMLPDDGRKLPKLKGIVHADKNEMDLIADELTSRGVCKWIPLDQVVKYRGEPVLNGLFGVEKSSRTHSNKCVLRLIMNLVGSNSIMRQFTGAVKNLPSITSWLSTVLEDNQQIRIWQSDMSSAFYLFQVPDIWASYLSFNVIRDRIDPMTNQMTRMALACVVLPMGWLSSVSIMQEISENILLSTKLDKTEQLVRTRPVPPWMVDIVRESEKQGRNWWHIYLDNFAGGQAFTDEEELALGERIHLWAEEAWKEAGVVSSEKKRVSAASTACELGAFIDGEERFIGGSPERLLRLVQATCWLLGQSMLSKRLVQVVVGRWIHVFQFRRPAMTVFAEVWKYTGQKGVHQGCHQRVRKELAQCLLLVPLLQTFLGAGISDKITASDASGTGGAVGLAHELTPVGESYVKACRVNQLNTKQVPILVISLFGGIGGAFRTYDVLNLKPLGLLHFDIHAEANRVVSRRWPEAEIFGDVRLLTKDLLHEVLGRYLGVLEIHLWAGFPCTDLSSAKFGGQGLMGPASSLFFEVLRIIKMLKHEVGRWLQVKWIVENVASMKPSERKVISEKLGVEPYFLECADAVPMHRPRLCWCSESFENILEGVEITEEEGWYRVWAEAPYPAMVQWVEPGVTWPGGDDGAILPTAMKSIPRKVPPPRPAGLERCDWDTRLRYEADSYRYPPYQYHSKFIFHTERGTWRTISVEEKELLLGYGWNHTALCLSASDIKKSKIRYLDERHSLLGDSFSIYSFVIAAAAVSRAFIPHTAYKWIAGRMGLAPGIRIPFRIAAPLSRSLQYGDIFSSKSCSVQELNRWLLTRTNHTGSDVRIVSGEILNPKAHPRQGVEAAWWTWLPSFKVKWKHKAHINQQELRSILLSLRYHISHFNAFNLRIFHITDSYVCMSIVGKGRTSSHQMSLVLRQFNALLLSHGLHFVLGHVESTQNPTDGESRSMDTGG